MQKPTTLTVTFVPPLLIVVRLNLSTESTVRRSTEYSQVQPSEACGTARHRTRGKGEREPPKHTALTGLSFQGKVHAAFS